jgi:hypothetical protein
MNGRSSPSHVNVARMMRCVDIDAPLLSCDLDWERNLVRQTLTGSSTRRPGRTTWSL